MQTKTVLARVAACASIVVRFAASMLVVHVVCIASCDEWDLGL